MEFDPYAQWLRIPADRRPPSYYDLLGLPAFESDAARIRQCVLERSEQVRRYQLGPHSQSAIQLLGELSRAFDTLTSPDRKRQYDRRLAGMATEDSSVETVVADPTRPPPLPAPDVAAVDEAVPPPAPTSPFPPGYVPASTDPVTPPPKRIRRALAAGLRRAPRALIMAGVSTVVLSAKATWWTLRMADRAMCKSLGDENAILHNFFRTVLVGGVLCGLVAAGWMWPQIRQILVERDSPPPPIDVSLRGDQMSQEQSSAKTTSTFGDTGNPVDAARVVDVPKPHIASSVQNSLGMLMISIAPGQFSMGSPTTEAGRIGTEQPHVVQLTRAFYLGAHEVTQGQFQQVMGSNPSHFSAPKRGALLAGVDVLRLPVDSVPWPEAAEFCRRLTARPEEQSAGRSYRLPTEAEWEYACRAGSVTPYASGVSLDSNDANFKAPGLNTMLLRTMVVGSYPANAFGLFDMHGNVEEWCGDLYDYGYYRTSPQVDPRGPLSGLNRVARGGSYLDTAEECRSARRVGRYPSSRVVVSGFRVACEVAK